MSPSVPSPGPNLNSIEPHRHSLAVPLLVFSTKGSGSNDEDRIKLLLQDTPHQVLSFNYSAKAKSAWQILKTLLRQKKCLVIMEGTGVAGGVTLMVSRILGNTRYIVSSGDAVEPFLSSFHPYLKSIFSLYEKSLYRLSSGFIGWTPYLCGRALSLGAKRAITAEGFFPLSISTESFRENRAVIRNQLEIPPNTIVVGNLGNLAWHPRYQYCYGLELVRASTAISRQDMVFLVVGGGTGLEHLRKLATEAKSRVILTGPLPQHEAFRYLSAVDIGSVPQSVDGVGAFRYTTKVSEYLFAKIPFITNRIPMAYDLDKGNIVRLPGKYPWSPAFQRALEDYLTHVSLSNIRASSNASPSSGFDMRTQQLRTSAFIRELAEEI